MKPAPFKYYAPTSIEEALSRVAEFGYDAKILAGGQSLIPSMNFRLAQPSILIDLNNIPELFYIRPAADGGVSIGAMTRESQVEHDPLIAAKVPLVTETMPFIAHQQIRNRGTYGGCLAHADPAAELPAVTVALNGRIKLRSQSGERWIPAHEFFVGLFTTQIEADEILVQVDIPAIRPHTGWSFKEISRRHGDYALAGAAALITLDGGGVCQQASLVFLSVSDIPAAAQKACAMLEGQIPTHEALKAAAETAASEEIDPSSDIHASADYRRHLARVLAFQSLSEAFDCAKAIGG